MKRLFVTGTDTGVGKTYVTAALARRARALGKRVFAFKPVETGCEFVDGRLVGPDQEAISAAAGDWQQGPLRGLYQFAEAVAPIVAAERSSTRIDVGRIVETANSVPDVDVLLVEGAGGWRVPIIGDEDMSTLAKRLDAAVVVVARAGLGTINHSLLTLEAIERDGLTVAALVLSRRPEEDPEFAESNCEQITRRWLGPCLVFASELSDLDRII